METTEWIDARTQPVRIGVYETLIEFPHTGFQYWNGTRWSMYAFTPMDAHQDRRYKSAYQTVKWRGLTKPSEVA